MKNKSLNQFANRLAKKQVLDLKLMNKIKGGSEPPPIEDGD